MKFIHEVYTFKIKLKHLPAPSGSSIVPPNGRIFPVSLLFSAPSIGTSIPDPARSVIVVPTKIGSNCPEFPCSYIPVIKSLSGENKRG